jgi:fatty-acid desaturase
VLQTSVATGRAPYSLSTLNIITAFFMVIFHGLAAMAFFYFSWTNLFVALALHWLAVGFGISLGYHRRTPTGATRPRRRSSTSSRCAAR